MNEPSGSLDQTKLLSTIAPRAAERCAYLIRIHPVVIGEGIIALPEMGVIMGRDADCGVILDDQDVSRKHASIESDAGHAFFIRDLNSTNGTLVNDKKVERNVLESGDLIRVGKTVLKFLRGNNIERQYYETVYSMMINDGLTGIPNKRYLQEAVQRELTRSQRHNRPLSLAVLDIDHFKKINDTYGHLSGDAVLRELSRRISKAVRRDEVFARYGGEEFVVLLPESTLEQASQFAERIRTLICSEPMEVQGTHIPVTVSIGVSHTAGDQSISAEKLFAVADGKLYEAKASGRNRVVW